MATCETVLRSVLVGDSTINTATGGRIHPLRPAANTDLPYVVYRVIGQQRPRTFAGPCGVSEYTVAIEVWSNTHEQASTIAEAVEDRLLAYSTLPVQRFEIDSTDFSDTDEGWLLQKTFRCWLNI